MTLKPTFDYTDNRYDDRLTAVIATKGGMVDAYWRRAYDDEYGDKAVYMCRYGKGRNAYIVYDSGRTPTLADIVRLGGRRSYE